MKVIRITRRGSRWAILAATASLIDGTESMAANQFIFCSAVVPNKGHYFSDVFEGSWLDDRKFQNAFNAFLGGHYGVQTTDALCFAESDRGEAKQKRDSMEQDARRMRAPTIETGWSY